MNRTLIASALAAGALFAAAGTASAEPPAPADPGVRCAAKIGPGQYVFFLPGERATDVNGTKWVCGPDGNWFRDYSAIRAPHTTVSQVVASWTIGR